MYGFQIQLVEPLYDEEARIRADRLSQPVDHAEEMMKRMAKIREKTSDIARANFNVALRERNQSDAKLKKSNVVRQVRSDIKLMEDIRVRQMARLRAIEKAEQEDKELQAKIRVVIKMQRIFRHYMPFRLAKLKAMLEANKAAQTAGQPKKVHRTLTKVKLTYKQEKSLMSSGNNGDGKGKE